MGCYYKPWLDALNDIMVYEFYFGLFNDLIGGLCVQCYPLCAHFISFFMITKWGELS